MPLLWIDSYVKKIKEIKKIKAESSEWREKMEKIGFFHQFTCKYSDSWKELCARFCATLFSAKVRTLCLSCTGEVHNTVYVAIIAALKVWPRYSEIPASAQHSWLSPTLEHLSNTMITFNTASTLLTSKSGAFSIPLLHSELYFCHQGLEREMELQLRHVFWIIVYFIYNFISIVQFS